MALGKESLRNKFWWIRCFRFFSCLARLEFSILFSVCILFLSNERAKHIYYIISKFTALKYKPNKCIYLAKWTPQVVSTVYTLSFISFVDSFLSIITLLLLFLVTLSGISNSLDNTGIVSVFFQATGASLLWFSNIPSVVLQYHGAKGSTGTVFFICILTVIHFTDSNPPFHSF